MKNDEALMTNDERMTNSEKMRDDLGEAFGMVMVYRLYAKSRRLNEFTIWRNERRASARRLSILQRQFHRMR